MPRHPSEVFGYPVDVKSPQAQMTRGKHWCPFMDKRCDKQSRLVSYPMGVCSVQYADQVVALCPRRFLQDKVVFQDVADHYFGSRGDLVVFQEVNLQGVGSFDYVIVKHKPLSSDIEDFLIVEVQGGQTSGTGRLVQALEDFLQGKDIVGRTYGFGLNTYDIWKRSFTQILNKGIVMENWGQKICWVVQEPVYQYFVNRYGLTHLTYSSDHTTRFMVYDLHRDGERYVLSRTRVESSSIDDLFLAFRYNAQVPGKDRFVETLRRKLSAQMHLKLQLAG